MKKLLIGLIISCFSSVLVAEGVQLKEGHPEVYKVKEGDTLWDISNLFLQNPWLWPEIWHANPQIQDPHLIYPGDTLAIVYVDGPSSGGDGSAASQATEGSSGDSATSTNASSNRAGKRAKLTVVERGPVKLAPGQAKLTPSIRRSELSAAIPAIPLEKINAFLTKSRIVTKNVLEEAPYVIAADNEKVIAGAGDYIFARGEFDPDEKVFGFFRYGQTYIDPITGEGLGMQAIDIGSGRIISRKGDVVKLVVNESTQEVRVGDKLLANEQKKVTATFYPKAPELELKGQIVAVEGGVTQVGTYDIVIINLGEREGIEEGHILQILQTGAVVKDRVKNELIQLFDDKAGLMIVFRSFEKMSYGLVLQSNEALKVGDRVATP